MILRNKVRLHQHIENLKELKAEYAAKGDRLNVSITERLIQKQELALKSIEENGD